VVVSSPGKLALSLRLASHINGDFIGYVYLLMRYDRWPKGCVSLECFFQVVVTDDELASVQCPSSPAAVNNDAGLTTTSVTFGAATASDNVGVAVSLSCNASSGAAFSIGLTTVVCAPQTSAATLASVNSW